MCVSAAPAALLHAVSQHVIMGVPTVIRNESASVLGVQGHSWKLCLQTGPDKAVSQ